MAMVPVPECEAGIEMEREIDVRSWRSLTPSFPRCVMRRCHYRHSSKHLVVCGAGGRAEALSGTVCSMTFENCVKASMRICHLDCTQAYLRAQNVSSFEASSLQDR